LISRRYAPDERRASRLISMSHQLQNNASHQPQTAPPVQIARLPNPHRTRLPRPALDGGEGKVTSNNTILHPTQLPLRPEHEHIAPAALVHKYEHIAPAAPLHKTHNPPQNTMHPDGTDSGKLCQWNSSFSTSPDTKSQPLFNSSLAPSH
jgi:hypothetical protein